MTKPNELLLCEDHADLILCGEENTYHNMTGELCFVCVNRATRRFVNKDAVLRRLINEAMFDRAEVRGYFDAWCQYHTLCYVKHKYAR